LEVVKSQAARVLEALGEKVKNVTASVGAEQEYFLIDKEYYKNRTDLMYCGRTLFGVKPPKAQELSDHYYGNIKPRVKEFMTALDEELWKLGIYAKTEHNEVAPAQHELAPIFSDINTACDQNQLIMETMKKVADRFGLVCLLHEKPFDFVNGSGKHNNWSLEYEGGRLFKPGKNPRENYKFLLFLCAVIRAVDLHQDLLRISVASAGNDHRLGGAEAPPAIISMFLGDEITNLLNSFLSDSDPDKTPEIELETGVSTLPHLKTDGSDRNRTSPFAFTGNKFEFRMVGSSQSIADCNTVLNTIVAESLGYFADILEKEEDKKEAIIGIIKETVVNHGRIIFNGNGYDEEWQKEAFRRGLLNLKTTADCVPLLCSDKNIELFEKYGIYSREELVARTEILLDNYCKVVNIEAVTMISMANRYIYGGVIGYINKLKGCANLLPSCERTIKILAVNLEKMVNATDELSDLLHRTESLTSEKEMAESYRDDIIPKMAQVREAADMLDRYTEKEFWPLPTYGDLLLRI
ncbi:MAG: glutamine synthetase type III, partial [Oscillospiraceae bacterium]|nr:glutamine synthetase type III [Candidatus Equicaccousia limihippi]